MEISCPFCNELKSNFHCEFCVFKNYKKFFGQYFGNKQNNFEIQIYNLIFISFEAGKNHEIYIHSYGYGDDSQIELFNLLLKTFLERNKINPLDKSIYELYLIALEFKKECDQYILFM